jgi:MFS family permease
MSNNAYAPPSAELKDAPPRPGSPFKAVALGLLVDIGGSVIAGAIVSVGYAFSLARQGIAPEQIAVAMRTDSLTTWFGVLCFLMGTGFSYLGGWVCARVARRSELLVGACLALLTALIAVVVSGRQASWSYLLLNCVAAVVAIMAGALHGKLKNGRYK